MTFTTGTLNRCSGNNHYYLPITIGGVTEILQTTVAEFQQETPSSIAEAREAIMDRLRSAWKEANAANWTQSKTALENKTFKI